MKLNKVKYICMSSFYWDKNNFGICNDTLNFLSCIRKSSCFKYIFNPFFPFINSLYRVHALYSLEIPLYASAQDKSDHKILADLDFVFKWLIPQQNISFFLYTAFLFSLKQLRKNVNLKIRYMPQIPQTAHIVTVAENRVLLKEWREIDLKGGSESKNPAFILMPIKTRITQFLWIVFYLFSFLLCG